MKQKAFLKDDILDLKKINDSVSKYVKFPKIAKKLFKCLTKVWSEETDEPKRVMALLTILKALKSESLFHGLVMKMMFSAFVRNSKFISGLNLGQVNFMRYSLLEVYGFNYQESYAHAFVFIRQLAIMLRKAYDTKSKDDVKAIFSWQFVNSLQFWSEYVARFAEQNKLIATLRYPLVQLIIATVRLNPGERWLPIRFHCVNMLITLSGAAPIIEYKNLSTKKTDSSKSAQKSSTTLSQPSDINAQTDPKKVSLHDLQMSPNVYTPCLNLLLDVFQLTNLRSSGVQNRKGKKKGGKVTGTVLGGGSGTASAVDLRLFLHLSPSQRRETATKDACISWLVDGLARCLAVSASSIAFPELAAPVLAELSDCLSACHVPGFTNRLRPLLAKTKEHVNYVKALRQRRRPLPISLVGDEEAGKTNMLSVVENTILNDPAAPFAVYFAEHREQRIRELTRLTEINKKLLVEENSASTKIDANVKRNKFAKKDHKNSANFNNMEESEGSDDDDDDDAASVSSGGSYDLDDGRDIVHMEGENAKRKNNRKRAYQQDSDDESVSDIVDKKSKAKKKKNSQVEKSSAEESDQDDDDDFDLEKALQEKDSTIDEPDAVDVGDEVTDFELGSSEDDDESGSEYNDVSSKHTSKKSIKNSSKDQFVDSDVSEDESDFIMSGEDDDNTDEEDEKDYESNQQAIKKKTNAGQSFGKRKSLASKQDNNRQSNYGPSRGRGGSGSGGKPRGGRGGGKRFRGK